MKRVSLLVLVIAVTAAILVMCTKDEPVEPLTTTDNTTVQAVEKQRNIKVTSLNDDAFWKMVEEAREAELKKVHKQKNKTPNITENTGSWYLDSNAIAKAKFGVDYYGASGSGTRHAKVKFFANQMNPGYRPMVGAISLTMDVPEFTNLTFDNWFLTHGYLFYNVSQTTGHLLVAWFSLDPWLMPTSGWSMFEFTTFKSGDLLFIHNTQDDCDIGIDGISSYNTTWENNSVSL